MPRMMYKASDLYTISGAASLLGIQPETAHRQARRGRLKVVLTGDGKLLVSDEEVERYRREVAGKSGRQPTKPKA